MANASKITEDPKSSLVPIDFSFTYPFYGLVGTFVESKRSPIQIVDIFKTIELPIGAEDEDQKRAAWQALDELTAALNVHVPDLTNQPKNVVAATYARKLAQKTWNGWMFAERLQQLPLVDVQTVQGVSDKHHKKFVDYHFSKTDKTVDRDDVLFANYSPQNGWWYRSRLDPKPITDVPDDFLLWFDQDKQDRGDVTDYWLITNSLGISDPRLLKAVFYQIKFEGADVIYADDFYLARGTNLPGNIFSRDNEYLHSLPGMMILKENKFGMRPLVDKIYKAAVAGKLPNGEWNNKWEIRKKVMKAG